MIATRQFQLPIVMATLLAWSCFSQAQEPTTKAADSPATAQPSQATPTGDSDAAEKDKDKPIVKVYDIRDLVKLVNCQVLGEAMVPPTRAYVNQAQNNTGSNGLFVSNNGCIIDDDPLELNKVRDLVVNMVDRESWGSPWGSGLGQSQMIGWSFVVSQTPANHNAIEKLFKTLREENARGQQVTISAKWIYFEGPTSLKAERALETGDVANALESAQVLHKGLITCSEGQMVQIVSGRGQNVLLGAEPVVGSNTSDELPVVKMVHWGAFLELKPVLTSDRKSVTLKFNSVLSEPKELGKIPLRASEKTPATAPASAIDSLDRLDFSVQSLAATVKMPLGKPFVAGGMSAPDGKGKTIYLILEANAK